jgi:hypothetical protein
VKTNYYHRNEKEPRTTPHPLRWCCLPLCLAALWVGCAQDSSGKASTSHVGTYTLVSVDGNQVPCRVTHQGKEGPTVTSGSFVISSNGTCSSRVVFVAPSGDEATREVKASYTRKGSKLTMKWDGAGTTTGTVEGDTFTMKNEGMIFAYRK